MPDPSHRIPRLSAPPATHDAHWDCPPWASLPALELTHTLGNRTPAHRPRVQVRLAYDDQALYVRFRVEDRYVRAVAPAHQGEVWKDSCAEFFFVPGADLAGGYFNLEMNAGGTLLFHFRPQPKQNVVPVSPDDLAAIAIAHSLPTHIEPELTEPVVWTLGYRLPVARLEKYRPVTLPAPGVIWRANFFKCADQTSHPHWLTWAPVEASPLGFHRPDRFGQLVFE